MLVSERVADKPHPPFPGVKERSGMARVGKSVIDMADRSGNMLPEVLANICVLSGGRVKLIFTVLPGCPLIISLTSTIDFSDTETPFTDSKISPVRICPELYAGDPEMH
jgi:hypothetical protein